MKKILRLLLLGSRKVKIIIKKPFWQLITKIIFISFGVKHQQFTTYGIPYVFVKDGTFEIGEKFKMNNDYAANIIGRQQKCIFVVNRGKLIIGKNVGMSSTAIICHNFVKIGNNVLIGGNTVIYDTDFHSLNVSDRIQIPENKDNVRTAPVIIGNNVFIGGHTTILKGVTIGENSIIGAGSVVTKNIPANEIWAGNPICRIKKL